MISLHIAPSSLNPLVLEENSLSLSWHLIRARMNTVNVFNYQRKKPTQCDNMDSQKESQAFLELVKVSVNRGKEV